VSSGASARVDLGPFLAALVGIDREAVVGFFDRRRRNVARVRCRLDGLADDADQAVPADVDVANALEPCDEPRRARRAPEAALAERVRELIERDAARRGVHEIAHDVDQLVVRRRVRVRVVLDDGLDHGPRRRLPMRRGRLRSRRHVVSASAAPGTPAAPAASATAPTARIAVGRDARHFLAELPAERAIREAPVLHAEARGDVADGVERLVVGDDVDHVAWPRAGEPDARGDGDTEVAPVADAGRRGAVHEVRAVLGEQARRLVSDHAPVPDRGEVGVDPDAVDHEVSQHVFDVLCATGVLDVEEDPAALLGTGARRRRRRDARRKRRLRDHGHDGRDERRLDRKVREGARLRPEARRFSPCACERETWCFESRASCLVRSWTASL
jgi:hypothetical protein